MKTLEQVRAQRAYIYISCVKGKEIEKEYKSLARRLPQMITQNGLLTTLAFLKSKAKVKDGQKNAHYVILEQVTEYLSESFNINLRNYNSLIEELLKTSVEHYLHISEEAVKFSTWLKRIADGELEDDGE